MFIIEKIYAEHTQYQWFYPLWGDWKCRYLDFRGTDSLNKKDRSVKSGLSLCEDHHCQSNASHQL